MMEFEASFRAHVFVLESFGLPGFLYLAEADEDEAAVKRSRLSVPALGTWGIV